MKKVLKSRKYYDQVPVTHVVCLSSPPQSVVNSLEKVYSYGISVVINAQQIVGSTGHQNHTRQCQHTCLQTHCAYRWSCFHRHHPLAQSMHEPVGRVSHVLMLGLCSLKSQDSDPFNSHTATYSSTLECKIIVIISLNVTIVFDNSL